MATLNKVMLIGRLTDNPEPPRSLPSGGTVVKFRFAVGRSKKDPATGNWVNDPNPLYIDCEAFARPDSKRDLVALISQYAKKGDPLFIEGRLQLDQWDDKQSGQKRSKHKVVVESVEFLGARNAEGGAPAGAGGGASYGGKPAGGAKNSSPPPDDGEEYGGGGSGDGGDIPF
jgi:single-strand DNA-binding protein